MNFKNERLLIISPHADDEVLGCFSLIDKVKKDGGEVYVQILTLGGYTRTDSKSVKKEKWEKEFVEVSKQMDINKYDIMLSRHKIQWLDKIPISQIIGYLESKSKISLFKLKPTIVAIPTIFASHQDHTITYKASTTALRNNPRKEYPLPKMILSYESPEYNFWSPYMELGKFSPNFYIKMSHGLLKKKNFTFNLYKSQLREGKRGERPINGLAQFRGYETGSDYAEAFHIHRFFV